MNSQISPPPDAESELLLRCCAASPDFAAIRQLADRGVDWNRFLALANRNIVTPMVAARLDAAAPARVPAHAARALALSCQVNALRSQHLARCAAEIADSLAADGVPTIAIKGPTLALRAYGDLAMRVFGDLDFLVRPSDLPRAAKALERLGYSSSAYRAEVVASGFFPDASLDFSREDSVVDLHWRLSPSYFPFAPDGDQIWNRSVEADLPAMRVRVLDPGDSILFQACHGSKHGWTTLARICDFAHLLATAKPASWTRLLDTAQQMHSLRMVLLGADLAHSLGLCEVPAELLAAARGDSSVPRLRRRVTRAIFDSDRAGGFDEWSIGLGCIESARDRVRYIVERVIAPKMSDRAMMPLPRALYPLYYLARPILVAIKHRERLFGNRSDARRFKDQGV